MLGISLVSNNSASQSIGKREPSAIHLRYLESESD